ncbi:MAG: hypothetical protein ABIF71_04220 [Planctomycetota bacterium]
MVEIKCPHCGVMVRLAKIVPALDCPRCKKLIDLGAEGAGGSGPDDGPPGAGRTKLVIGGAIGAAVLVVAIVLGVMLAARSRYNACVARATRDTAVITAADSAAGIAACETVMARAGRDTDTHRAAAFNLGAYQLAGGRNEQALAAFNACIDSENRALESAVYAASLLADLGRNDDACRLANRLIEQIDSPTLPPRLKERAAEAFARTVDANTAVPLTARAARLVALRDRFPLNQPIAEAAARIKKGAAAEAALSTDQSLQALAALHAPVLRKAVDILRTGIEASRAEDYPAAYVAFETGLAQAKGIPVEDPVFRDAFEKYISGRPPFGQAMPFMELAALFDDAARQFKELPGILRTNGYAMQNGTWTKVEARMVIRTDSATAGTIDRKELVLNIVKQMAGECAAKPAAMEVVQLVVKPGSTKYEGQIKDEDAVSLTIVTMLGSVKLMKDSITERKPATVETREAQLKRLLDEVLAGGDQAVGLRKAAEFARNNRLVDEARGLAMASLYLNPTDRELIAYLKFENVVYQACPTCMGRGYVKPGEKAKCETCQGNGKVKCKTCGGEGKTFCTNCERFGANQGKVLKKKDMGGGRIVTRYENCPECNGSLKVKCKECEKGFYTGSKCPTCNGEGTVWKVAQEVCTECEGRRIVFNPEYIKDPYTFLKGLQK